MLRWVLLPERPHLRIRGVDWPQLPLLPQLIEQALLQNPAALLIRQPAAPFFLRQELGGAELRLKLGDRRELLPHVLYGLLDLVLDFLVGDLDRGVALCLLDHQLLVHHLTEHLAPRRGPAGARAGDPCRCPGWQNRAARGSPGRAPAPAPAPPR